MSPVQMHGKTSETSDTSQFFYLVICLVNMRHCKRVVVLNDASTGAQSYIILHYAALRSSAGTVDNFCRVK